MLFSMSDVHIHAHTHTHTHTQRREKSNISSRFRAFESVVIRCLASCRLELEEVFGRTQIIWLTEKEVYRHVFDSNKYVGFIDNFHGVRKHGASEIVFSRDVVTVYICFVLVGFFLSDPFSFVVSKRYANRKRAAVYGCTLFVDFAEEMQKV